MRDAFKSVFDNDYQGYTVFLEKVIRPIFGEDLEVLPIKDDITADIDREALKKANIKSIYRVAQIDSDTDVDIVEVFDVTLEDNANISRSRVGIQRIIRSKVFHFTHAFMVFHYENPEGRNWRFSYAYKRGTQADTTEAKRYTYLFGKNLHCRTAIDRFVTLATSKKDNMAFLEAFSVEALSDEFFAKYRKQYAKFVRYITGKEYVKEGSKWVEKQTGEPNERLFSAFDHNEKTVRDYIKKLMGRITFLHFLQRKGWMCGDYNFMLNLFEKSDKKDDYLDAVLEPLFFGILNTKPKDRKVLFTEQKWDTSLLKEWADIPYLNGGLFEADEEDGLSIDFPKDYFSELLEFYSEYNFMVDENDPDDAEVGVDPEMLGKIFENLLEDNKDKGAFYTPKEIVRYMCQESLIAYLVEKSGIEEAQVRAFVTNPYEKAEKLNVKDIDTLFEALEVVKICDPAIGSGAFPMGLLNELVRCEEALVLGKEENKDRVQLKKQIIKNNIYGVDIEKGAIDIARLRFWLSLIVDEDVPSPLPNLDYKIMQGNSLLESYKGLDLSHILDGQDGLIDFGGTIREELNGKIEEYYSCTDHQQKKQLQRDINDLVHQQIVESGQVVQGFEHIDVAANQDFFLWHTWFSDVFNRPSDCNGKGGFDIVIGNPPYFQMPKGVVPIDLYPYAEGKDKGKQNIYKLFVEQSYNLLKGYGTGCLITQSSLLCDISAQYTRELLLMETTIHQVIEFPKVAPHKEGQLFKDALVATCITLFQKAKPTCDHEFFISAGNDLTTLNRFDFASIMQTLPISFYPNGFCLPLVRGDDFTVVEKMNSATIFLREFIDTSSQGDLNLTSEKAYYSTLKTSVKMYRGCNVHRYHIDDNVSEYIQIGYKEGLVNKNIHSVFLVCQQISGMTDKNRFNVSLSIKRQCLYGNSVNKISVKELDAKYILAILNSKAIDWYFRKTSTNNHINIYELEQMPIPIPNESQKDKVISLVDAIMAAKQHSLQLGANNLEKELDVLVYDLFGFTKREIQIVEGYYPSKTPYNP